MWGQLLQGVLAGMASGGSAGGGQSQPGQMSGSSIPGMNAQSPASGAQGGGVGDILMQMLGQAQPRSGAVGLPQQQAQLTNAAYTQQPPQDGSAGMVLPPKQGLDGYGQPMSDIPGLPPLNGLGGAPQPMGDFNQIPTVGGMPQTIQQPMGGMPDQMVGGLQQAQQQQGGGPNWGNMLNMTGTAQNPNAFTRMGVGYNAGGLMGALGYLLTDLSQQNNRPQGGGY